jgi:UDP-N-acetylmuramate--alanine ligase
LLPGADGRAIARAVRSRAGVEPVFVETLEELPAVLEDLLADGDLVLTMGAGDIGAFALGLPALIAHGPQLKVQK